MRASAEVAGSCIAVVGKVCQVGGLGAWLCQQVVGPQSVVVLGNAGLSRTSLLLVGQRLAGAGPVPGRNIQQCAALCVQQAGEVTASLRAPCKQEIFDRWRGKYLIGYELRRKQHWSSTRWGQERLVSPSLDLCGPYPAGQRPHDRYRFANGRSMPPAGKGALLPSVKINTEK